MSQDTIDLIKIVIDAIAALGVLTIPILIWSITVLTKQNRLAGSATMLSAWQNIFKTMIGFDRFFYENPTMKPYFYDNCDLPQKNTPLYNRIMSVAEMLVDFMDQAIVLHPFVKDNPIVKELNTLPWDDWERFFRRLFVKSPALRTYWNENRPMYSKIVNQKLEKMYRESLK